MLGKKRILFTYRKPYRKTLRVSTKNNSIAFTMRGAFLGIFLLLIFCLVQTSALDFFGGKSFNSFPPGGNPSSSTKKDDEYYKVLGVSAQSSENEVKKAYRKKVCSFYFLLPTVLYLIFIVVTAGHENASRQGR
jgi:hypothetical protein